MSNEKLQIGKAGQIGSELLREVLRLDTEERSALVTLLQGMWGQDINWSISQGIVDYWLRQIRAMKKICDREADEERKLRKESAARDNLPHEQQIEQLLSIICEETKAYEPPFVRKVLDKVMKNEPTPDNWKNSAYLLGKLNRIFKGCGHELREKVIEKYLNDIMPALEKKWQTEKAIQAAIDELMSLVDKLSLVEIRELTERARKELLRCETD